MPPGDVELSDVRGPGALELLPAQPSEVVAQLNAAARAPVLWPWALALTVILAAALSPWLLVPGVVLVTWLWWHGKVSRTVALCYEVNGPRLAGYQTLLSSFTAVREAQDAWYTVASGEVRTTYQRKVNAGAGHLVERRSLSRGVDPGPHIATNIEVPTLRSAGRTVYLLPDRMLVKDGRTYADVDYRSLQVDFRHERFIETGRVPRDAAVVDWTWRFVNKNGGPDRRFKDNARLPVMNYGQVEIRGSTGLHLLWSFSRADAGQRLAGALLAMRR